MRSPTASLKDKLDAFCAFAQAVGKAPCLIGKTSMPPQVLGPFIVVWLSEWEPAPRDTSVHEDRLEPVDGRYYVQKMRGLGIMHLEVQGFGPDSIQRLKHVAAAIETDIWYEVMGDCGMGFSTKSSVQNISSTLTNSMYEERAMFTCEFYTSCPEEYGVQYFDHEGYEVTDEGSGRSYRDVVPTQQQGD